MIRDLLERSLCTIIILFAALPATASPTARFTGRVLDTAGRPIAVATATAFAAGASSKPAASAQTDTRGVFTMDLVPGEYAILVHMKNLADTVETVRAIHASSAD